MINIILEIENLLSFGVAQKLINPLDLIASRNALYDLLAIDPGDGELPEPENKNITEVHKAILDYACEAGIVPDNTTTHRDLFNARIMGLLMPRQSEISKAFYDTYKKNPEQATDDFYSLCQASNYIWVDRIAKNIKWDYESEFGTMQITINLSKPEKDPREIAAAKNAPQAGYPKCLLCVENVGYAGNMNHPARQNLRVIPVDLDGEEWFFQYSPYVYYNEHCIVLNKHHVPMKLSEKGFRRLTSFVKQFPHYFIGSNADLPIVGGSILSHDHFQGGRHVFPMEKAKPYAFYTHSDFTDLKISLVHWPMSVIRISGENESLIAYTVRLLDSWREYGDENLDIMPYTTVDNIKTPHNTITPIARINDLGELEMDLVLRNNRTSEKHPLGIFHPHDNLHHIKKENIGLIEVMGLAVLPGRLHRELLDIEKILLGEDIECPVIHEPWVKDMLNKCGGNITKEEANKLIKSEVGRIFIEVLTDSGVYKPNEQGRAGFARFMEYIGNKQV